MKDFTKAKIYTVRSISRPDLIYVGSTVQPLSVRIGGHRSHKNTCSSKQIMILGDGYIELLEAFPCQNKDQLLARENHHMRLIDCVNKHTAVDDCTHGKRQTYCLECHGASICEHNKHRQQCVECHGTSICPHNKQKAQCKTCYPTTCCNKIFSKTSYARHLKSKKHIINIEHHA